MTDLVLILGTASVHDDIESRYLLRSAEANLVGLGKVFVVGHKPPWMQNVEHIPTPDNRRTRSANIIAKMISACLRFDLSERFIRCHDDYLFLCRIDADTLPVTVGRRIDNGHMPFDMQKGWHQCLDNTVSALRNNHITGELYHYDTHAPQPIHKAMYLPVMQQYEIDCPPGYGTNTLYFNHIRHAGAPLETVQRDDVKASFEHPDLAKSVPQIEQACNGRLFGGYNDDGLTEAMLVFMQHRWPNKSKYEV